MKRIIPFIALLLATQLVSAGKIYKSKQCQISFFSSAPLEDIEAQNKKGASAVNFENRKVFFKVPIKDFIFENSLMQSHFNENYMESDKYPDAKFSGVLDRDLDPKANVEQSARVKGELTIHGVTKTYTTTVRFKPAKDGTLSASSKFVVKLKDHNIDIPTMVVKKIAEEVSITVNVEYAEYKK